MLNQNLIKGIMPLSRSTPSTSFEDDLSFDDFVDKRYPDQNCFGFSVPFLLESETKTEEVTLTQPKPRQRARSHSYIPDYYRSTKNIAKNYGKAIASFACSDLAMPYLESIIENESCTMAEFMDYIRRNKEMIQGIDSFRAMLLPREADTMKEAAFKRVFQSISETFIKSFSVNWICHGKMKDKIVYLKFRFKILRRIRNPKEFTYLKKSKKKANIS